MKKIFILVLILYIAVNCHAASVTILIDDPNAIPAAGSWTSGIIPGGLPQHANIRSGDGYLNISVNGASWTGTVTLQRICIDPNEDVAWCDVSTYTANSEDSKTDHQPAIQYRIGCKNGEFTSGAVRASLNNACP